MNSTQEIKQSPLKMVFLARGCSYYDGQKEIGVSRNQLQGYAEKENEPSISNALLIARWAGVSAESLWGHLADQKKLEFEQKRRVNPGLGDPIYTGYEN